ncbi:hypothetical protein KFL_000260200 [Klebsormidium nitens]|uniref:Uncharacterized protein n=1 Tax=Klebsormidium nitens TaxID=105231 RepID=A0A1Y1HKS2_KLENI|nr:hypothetical protein KFL_000260200 [Klebsormidium nitens]|eukprot:GAQ79204.1 hypothetical protein KFL_000260200 [Klebsormidium nitens]
MRSKEDDERNVFDSQGKLDRDRPSPRGSLSDAWKSRAKVAEGMLGSSGFKKVNSVALCYLFVLLLIVGLSFQHHMSQSLKLSRLARSSKQWESLYSQSLEEIIDWKRKLEQEKKLAAEFAKNADLLEGTLKRVREEKSRQEEEAVKLQVDVASKDKLREQLERKLQESEDLSQTRLQEVQQEVQVKKLESEAMHRELEEMKQAVKYHKDTIARLNADKEVLATGQVKAVAAADAAKNKTAAMEVAVRELRDELKNATRHSIYLEEHVTSLTEKNKVLETEARSKLDSTAKRMQDEVDAANARVDAAQQEKRALEERVAQLESKLEQSQARVTELEEAADAAEKSRTSERERLESEIRDKEQRLQETEAAKRNEEAERERNEEAERKRSEEAKRKREEKEEAKKRREAQEKADAEDRAAAEASEKEEAQKRNAEEKAEADAAIARKQEAARRAEAERKAAAEQEAEDQPNPEKQKEMVLEEIRKDSETDEGASDEGANEAL